MARQVPVSKVTPNGIRGESGCRRVNISRLVGGFETQRQVLHTRSLRSFIQQ
jgi:hypothetical protein